MGCALTGLARHQGFLAALVQHEAREPRGDRGVRSGQVAAPQRRVDLVDRTSQRVVLADELGELECDRAVKAVQCREVNLFLEGEVSFERVREARERLLRRCGVAATERVLEYFVELIELMVLRCDPHRLAPETQAQPFLVRSRVGHDRAPSHGFASELRKPRAARGGLHNAGASTSGTKLPGDWGAAEQRAAPRSSRGTRRPGTKAATPRHMSTTSVHDAVETLHAALADSPTLTPDLRAELEHVLRDVERALAPREKPLAERASELTAAFEANHPKLAESLAALARALAGVGI